MEFSFVSASTVNHCIPNQPKYTDLNVKTNKTRTQEKTLITALNFTFFFRSVSLFLSVNFCQLKEAKKNK